MASFIKNITGKAKIDMGFTKKITEKSKSETATKPKIASSGFRFSFTAEDVTKDIDATMLTAIATGGSSGLGLETVRVLALRGAHVVIGARNLKGANDAKEIILKENPTARIDVLKLDLCSMKSVEEFVENFNALDLPLNILINNAGIMSCPYALSEDGVEMQFATNHLGPFHLTNLGSLLSLAKLNGGRVSETVPESVSVQIRVDDNFQKVQNLNFESLTFNLGGASTKDSEVLSFSNGRKEINVGVGFEELRDAMSSERMLADSDFGDNEKDFSTPPFQSSSFDESSVGSVGHDDVSKHQGSWDLCEGANTIKILVGHDDLREIFCPLFPDENGASGGLDPKTLREEKERWKRYAARLKDRVRADDFKLSRAPLPDGITLGNRVLFYGVYIDKVTLFRKLIPPPRAKKSRLTFKYWTNLVGRPLLNKMREADIDIDLDIYGDDLW